MIATRCNAANLSSEIQIATILFIRLPVQDDAEDDADLPIGGWNSFRQNHLPRESTGGDSIGTSVAPVMVRGVCQEPKTSHFEERKMIAILSSVE
jgi:hypothetical protein